jgi:DNA modification methylase
MEVSMRLASLIRLTPLSALKPSSNNPRRHSPQQIDQLAASIREFGFNDPILVDEEYRILAGHGRALAAAKLGLAEVPSIVLDHMTAAQKRAFIIAANRLAERSSWDRELLKIELGQLAEMDIGFELEVTGFDTGQIDVILSEDDTANGDDVVKVPAVGPPVTRAGDLWCLGPHRLLCGDARQNDAYTKLMAGKIAAMSFTDPPYNVRIAGFASGLGQSQHQDFVMAAGEMSPVEFTSFLRESFANMARASKDGSLHFICMDWRHLREILDAGDSAFNQLVNLVVWAKPNGGMGHLYRSRHELVFLFKKGTVPAANNVQLGRHGRNRSNVWEYAGASSFGATRDVTALHPTPKPVALIADAIKDVSKRGDVVLDPFAGSGSTIIAAERAGRAVHAIEIDPGYVDATLKRWAELGGDAPVLESSGEKFDDLAARRMNGSEDLRHV